MDTRKTTYDPEQVEHDREREDQPRSSRAENIVNTFTVERETRREEPEDGSPTKDTKTK